MENTVDLNISIFQVNDQWEIHGEYVFAGYDLRWKPIQFHIELTSYQGCQISEQKMPN